MILIICDYDDVHVKAVIDKLPQNSFFLLYTNLLLNRYKFYFTGISANIFDVLNGQTLDVNKVEKVWYRRTIAPRLKKKKGEEVFSDIRIREVLTFLNYLKVLLIKKDWLSGHPLTETQAQSKIDQLYTAINLGFDVPKTVFSNDKKFILETLNEKEQLAVKSIAPNLLKSNKYIENDIIFYTALISKKEFDKISASRIKKTVNFIQEYIEKDYELRITIVGLEAFSCKITSKYLPKDKGQVDFRQGYDYGLKYENYSISNDLYKLCINFLSSYNLNFGCFDFVVSQDGKIFFLECNSNGQWLWIEQENPNLQISNSIVRYLTSTHH